MNVLELFAEQEVSARRLRPRGAKTGTQALKNAREKARIPVMRCQHIVEICEAPYDIFF